MVWLKVFFLTLVISFTAHAVKFKKAEYKLSGHKLILEIAETHEQTQQGLMHRTELPAGTGMLFIFEEKRILSFWMMNTLIPLSIGFFDEKFVLVDMQDMEPMRSVMDTNLPTYKSRKPAKYALEVPKGWFAKKKIKLGAKLVKKKDLK